MKREIKRLPDKVIKLSHGDEVKIYATVNKLDIFFKCDEVGNAFTLTRKEIKELLGEW